MTNLQILIQQYSSATLDMNQVAEVLHLTPETARDKAAAGTLPFPTFKSGRKRLATIYKVAEFLDDQGSQ
jgi:hypothetical protein